MGFVKTKNFPSSKNTIRRGNRQVTKQEKKSTKHIANRINKEILQVNNRVTDYLIEKCGRYLNKQFAKENNVNTYKRSTQEHTFVTHSHNKL